MKPHHRVALDARIDALSEPVQISGVAEPVGRRAWLLGHRLADEARRAGDDFIPCELIGRQARLIRSAARDLRTLRRELASETARRERLEAQVREYIQARADLDDLERS